MVCMGVGKLKTNKQTKLSHPELKEHIPELDPQASRQAPPRDPTGHLPVDFAEDEGFPQYRGTEEAATRVYFKSSATSFFWRKF